MKKSLFKLIAAAAMSGATLAAAQTAEPFPTKSIRLLVGFAAGGPTDVIARVIAQKLTEAWGQQVVVDNRAGAGGNIGMGIATQALPDGPVACDAR